MAAAICRESHPRAAAFRSGGATGTADCFGRSNTQQLAYRPRESSGFIEERIATFIEGQAGESWLVSFVFHGFVEL